MNRSRLHLSFPEPLVERPVIYEAANRFGVVPNIRRANVETHSGWVILELSGDQQAIDDAVSWFQRRAVWSWERRSAWLLPGCSRMSTPR